MGSHYLVGGTLHILQSENPDGMSEGSAEH